MNKHPEFTSPQIRTAGDDWIVVVWAHKTRFAHYFLCEAVKSARKVTGYVVSELVIAGESPVVRGLPKKFKTTEAATDWLENKLPW